MDRSEIRLGIAQVCRRLILSQNPVRLCDLEATPKQEEFLYRVFKEELEHRERLRKARLFQRAAFPVGKTHLAIALGVKACELGMATRFFTAASLVTRLSESKRAGHLERTVNELAKAELVIIDEWGYLPMDREEAQLLFQVIATSYERRSLVI